jgi:hypothetical protein
MPASAPQDSRIACHAATIVLGHYDSERPAENESPLLADSKASPVPAVRAPNARPVPVIITKSSTDRSLFDLSQHDLHMSEGLQS